ncbi:MAG: hypothetical protein WCO98_16735, partial [bacterium]
MFRKIVRGKFARAVSYLLMAFMMIPSFLMPAVSAHAADAAPVQSEVKQVAFLPMDSKMENTPTGLGQKIFRELQIMLAKSDVKVVEIDKKSPLLSRLKMQLGEKEAAEIQAFYDTAVDINAKSEDRVNAAANLVKPLGFDSIVLGTIDSYKYEVINIGAKKAMIHIVAYQVVVDENGKAKSRKLDITGKSKSYPGGQDNE